MNTISVFRDYMGEGLTQACILRLMQGPEEHIGEFLQRLYPCYTDWLKDEERSVARTLPTPAADWLDGKGRVESTYYCIDPLNRRRAWREKLNISQNEQPRDEAQFDREFRYEADALLASRVKELEKAAASSVLEKWLVPSALTLGASAIAFSVAGLPVPPTTADTAALVGPGNWAVDKMIKRFNKGGCRATVLREFYGYLLEKKN